MRNLKLKMRVCCEELTALGVPQCLSVRMDTHTLLIASAYAIIEYDPRTAQVVNEVSLTAEDYLPADGSGCVVGIQDLPDQECVCVATATGDVILYNLNTQQLECVGSVDSGLTGMSWSPDQELVTLTTGQQSIIMMTKDFEPITEVPIHQEDFGEGKFITVGWGKKETQFHGSEGKQAAQKRSTEVLPAVAWDDRKPRVTWRGDGQLFALSAVCPHTGARKVRVWNRECVLQATSETINGLEQALCWRPSGSLIASTQRHPNKHSVVFLEKNGLLHGDFTLPIHKDQARVRELLWNSDSTVLAVWLEDMNPGEDGHVNTQIQLWCVGNYHWYLKQCLRFGEVVCVSPVCVCWDPERPLVLHLLTRAWSCLTYQWGWTTNRSHGDSAHDNANVAVIDGDKVLVTAFAQCVVPPPMSSFELQCPAPVAMVTFCSEEGHSNDLAALTDDTRLCVYQQGEGEAKASAAGGFKTITHPPQLKNTYRVELGGAGPLGLRLVVWIREHSFLGVTDGEHLDQSKVLLLKPSANDSTLEISSQVCVPGQVISVCHSGRSNTVLLQLEDGQLQKLLWEGIELAAVPWTDSRGSPVNFPQACEHTALCSISGEEYPLGLTDRAHLYLGDTELASGVSSFVVCDDFLLLTTHTHTCRCLQLNTNTTRGLVSALGADGGQNDETIRRVERGSRIVTMVTHDTRIILQMPRGNLETIHHRALVLAQLRKRLDSLKFRDAFEVMRKQRINLNLIYDHNPKAFLENVEMFVKQVDSVNHINLFLNELREEDTTKSMYPPPANCPPAPAPAPAPAPGASGKKVDIVCDALRTTVEQLNPDRYCLCILTTHVKKTVPELETALQKVHQLRVHPPSSAEAVKAEEALKYLLFLVDVNELYTHSLGTYDFTLVLMVAEKSQKDPKEYLPFLNMLKSLEPNYQRYTIDKHLKRYSKALQHLSKCGEEYFSEALNLVKDQQLYKEALSLYSTDSPQYKELSGAYAEHLVERGQAEQAGLLLWRCGELGRALQAFVGGVSWRHALSVATQMPLPPDQLALLARDLADKLLEQRRYTEASVLLEQYAKDCEEAISALITGAAWEEALRLVYLYNRQDIIETNLKPALLEAYSTQVSFLESQRALFTRHQSRLAVVREEKEKAKLEMLEEGDCGEVELYSEASSVLSGSQTGSRYTHSNSRISARSSKNRRKAEGKKFSLKEGSPFEDTALLHALTHITHTVDKMREEVQGLLKALVLFQCDGQAGALQRDFSQLLTHIETNIPLIWTQHTPNTPVTGPNSTANSITASFQQQRAPPTGQQDPEALTPPKMRTTVKWKLCVLD